MITTEELVSFINHPQFKADLANECISICFSNNKHLSIDELGNVIEKNNNSSSEYEIVNPSAVIEFYKESIIEKINDCVDYGETYFLNELKNKVNLLEDIQDYCFSREESEAEFEREITYSNKSNLDLQEGFWTSTDGYKTKVHISTNYLSDEYVRLITSYERRENKVKNYIDNLIARNPNESYITISINPTTEEIEFTLNGINNGNLINLLKYDYKFHLIKDLSKLLYNVDTIDNSTTNEYKQQIGSNFEKYKEIVDSVIVEGLINSIYDIHKDDLYTSDEEHDCRYYCEFYGNYLDVYQDIDKNSEYRIGLVFNKKQECVDYFITRIRIIDGNVDYDVQKELSPYNKEIFRIAENKIKNLVLQKFHTQELYNISRNIDWSGFTEEMFNKFKNQLLTGNEKPDWKGSINVGSVSFEITQYEKTEENPCLDYKVFVLGEDNGYNYDNPIPYAFYEGNQFAINMITDNTYEQFKEKFTNLIIDDLKENNIQKSEHVKKEMMRSTIDWNNQEQSKQLYFEKLNGKNFYKTETFSNANELKFIINSLEPSLDFKNSDAEIVLDYLVGGEYLSFENNTLKYKGDDGKTYGENLFDVLKYIEANIEEHIENITMNIEDDFSLEEDQEYLKILKEQVLPSIQNKCNILRLKEIFKDKSSDMAFSGLEKANFDELYLDCKNSFPSKTDEELLVEAASRMIMNVNDFGFFSVESYDELFDKEDGADYRFSLCESAAKELIDSKIRDFSQVEEYIKNQSKEIFKNECLKELEQETFLDDVEKIVDLSIDSLDKDDYLDTYSYLTEEEYDRTKYIFDNFYKTENQTGSIDLKALYDSKESVDNVVTLENGAEIRKVIESDEGGERVYYDLYDKDVCSICDGENYEIKAEIDGIYYLKGLDSEYEDSGFALSTDEYLIATKQQNQGMQHEKEVEVLWNKGILLFKDTKYWEDILTETSADSKENDSFILSKLHSKFRQEIVDKFNPNENINWENESWNYICETMQRKSLDYDYSVNYNNGLTSKDLQDFIACDFITIKVNLQDKEMESLWEKLEDIPFIEDEEGRLILDSDEPWHNFEPGTTKEEIWHYFDRNHSKGINYLVNEYESKTKELQEQSKKEGYEAGYLFDNDESIITWNNLKKIDNIFSQTNFIEFIDEIKESNENLSEKELKEELVFRILEDNVDWHGFDHSLIDNEQIDSSKLLDTRCYILEQVSEAVVNKQINSFEKIQNKVDELLFNDSRAKDFFIMDCVKSEIDKDLDFWQEIDCDPKGNVNDTIGSYQFLAGISDEVAKKLGLSLRNEDEKLNYQYEILGTYEMIPEKFTESNQPFVRFDNREIDFYCNISSDDETFMKQEIFSFDFHDSNYSYDILYKYFDKCVAKSMEQTQEYELFLNNPQEYVEKCVLSIVAPTVPSEEISKEELNIEKDFKNLLLENLKTSKNPFEATYKIFEDLKEKNDTEKIKKFNQYLKDKDCNTKKDFEKFFTEIIGLTKKEPKRSIRKLKIERELER